MSVLRLILLFLLPLSAVAAGGVGSEAMQLLHATTDWLGQHPLLAPLLFILLYVAVVMLCLPGTLLCLAGGALFGLWFGTVLNVTGATLGACLAFVTARHLAAPQVERYLSGTLQQLKQGVEAEGWRFVAMVRLLPVVPYDLSSYAFGLSRIPLAQFAAANALCLLPRLFVYAYIGHRGVALLEEEGDRLLNLVALLTLMLAVLLLPHLYHRLRRAP